MINNKLGLLLVIMPLFGACASSPSEHNYSIDAKQQNIIGLWHECVDDNLQSLVNQSASSSPKHNVDHTLVVCQGYKQDVLDTFPLHMHSSLNKVLVNQVYESSYSVYINHKSVKLPVSPTALERLRRHGFKR